MMLMIFVLLLLSMTHAQEYLEDSEYDETNNVSCISKYRDLEAYVLNNKDLMDNLTETFFKTGKTSTEFVKIAYRFMVLQSFSTYNNTNTSYNLTNDTTYFDDDYELEFTYLEHPQRLFIWSSSALYLLGPKPLFWMTLFAVRVPEYTVTIQLPCLCEEDYDNLLSRLTYFVSIN